jgi:hypothetical protein
VVKWWDAERTVGDGDGAAAAAAAAAAHVARVVP